MSLTYRPSTLEDLTACLEDLRPVYGSASGLVPRLPDIWKTLLADGSVISVTVEDRTRPPQSRIVALGASVFLTDEFVVEAKSGRTPYVAGGIARAMLQKRSPVLGSNIVRRANVREGLNLCILHERYLGIPIGVLPDFRLKEKIVESYFYLHRGYRLKEFLQEVYGEAYSEWMQTSGVKMRTDYAPYYDRHGGCSAPRPYLLGLTRAEAMQQPGTRAFQMFLDLTPRFGFTEGQQELLRCALAGATDEQLAVSLCLSTSAIKKRWFTIYDCVMDIDPDLLSAASEEGSPGSEGRRGAERRRHLLNYLREHPEELHILNAAGR